MLDPKVTLPDHAGEPVEAMIGKRVITSRNWIKILNLNHNSAM